jgi:hypothetical protein
MIVMDQDQRQGFHVSSSALVPLGTASITVTADVHPDDQAATGKSLSAIVRQSGDGGKTWGYWNKFTWTSPNGSPSINFGVGALANRLLRVELDIPVTLGVGANINFS